MKPTSIKDEVVQVSLPQCESKFQWIDEILPFLGSGHYKYRGHADASWPLETSIERLNGLFRVKLPGPLLQETVLNAFKASSDLFFDWKPEDELEWFSQIQHYGGPTPMLDFTDSFWVALYFAVWPHIQSNAKSDFSVTGIRYTCLPNGLVFHHPKRLHARILAQQGLFLAKTDPQRTMDQILHDGGIDFSKATVVDNLEAARRVLAPDEDSSEVKRITAIRFVFPSSSAHQVLQYLYQMNVTGYSLFPDQAGAIQNLKNEFHLLRNLVNKPREGKRAKRSISKNRNKTH